jgi:CRP-like cAMP-binding protein
MPDPFDCLACQPALHALVAAQPPLARKWATLARRHWPAGRTILRMGQSCDRLWLIERGLARAYFQADDGLERNKSFHAEGAWIGGGIPPHVVPSPYAIDALEAVDAIEMSYDDLLECERAVPAVRALVDDALRTAFARQAQRESELLLLDATARYRAFLADYASLAARIPLHQVASYVGITNVALSRIRSRLARAEALR